MSDLVDLAFDNAVYLRSVPYVVDSDDPDGWPVPLTEYLDRRLMAMEERILAAFAKLPDVSDES